MNLRICIKRHALLKILNNKTKGKKLQGRYIYYQAGNKFNTDLLKER